MIGRFSMSRYAKMTPRPDGWAVYHSLFGNLCLLDDAGKRFLEAFKAPAAIGDVATSLANGAASGLHSYANQLIINGFLVPEGCDDYDIVEDNKAERQKQLKSGYLVRALQLVMTNRCNFRCRYCFMDFQPPERNDRGAGAAEGAMSVDVADTAMQTLLDLLRRNGNPYLNVEFFGGEPLLNWPVIRHVLTTYGNEPPGGVGVLYSITTNGALITAEMAEIFRANRVTVTLSIDGSAHGRPTPGNLGGPDLADFMPGWSSGGDKVAASLAILKGHGNAVTFNTVLSKETVHHFDGRRLLDFAKSWNVQMVGLILDLDLEFYKCRENRDQVLEMLWTTYCYGQEIGVPVVGYWHQMFEQIVGRQAINLRSGYKTCPATGCKISVEPDGGVYSCKCTSEPIGHIRRIDDILSSEHYAAYALHAYRNAPQCEGCEIDGFCAGICMGSLERDYQRIDMIESGSCEILRGITQRLIDTVNVREIRDLRLDGLRQ